MQDVALWHERDISHSSVERVVLPDSSQLAYYVMRRLPRLLDGLQVFPERMLANLDASYGLVFSQPVLLALVQAGLTRDDAYRIVQGNAMQAWDEGRDFRTLLEADDEVDNAVLDDAFDLRRSLRNLGHVLDQVDRHRALSPLSGAAVAAQSARPMPARFSVLAGTPTSRQEAYEIDLLSE